MLKKISTFAISLAAGLSMSAFAAPHGAGGGNPGGLSSPHISAQGMSNTNGPNALSRDKGMARAEERRSELATSHERADAAQTDHKRQHSGKRATR